MSIRTYWKTIIHHWTELQKGNEVVFTKLPYGNYVLKVRYKNDVFDSDAKEYFCIYGCCLPGIAVLGPMIA